MATNKYVDDYLKQNKAAMDEEIALRKNEAEHQLQLLEDQNKLDVADANAAYETAFRQNEVQRILNERYLDRKAAEMGLSSSGMNLTQQTANQLSYGNQKAALTAQKQKTIDTLAQTMKARKYEVESARDADIGAIKSGYNASAYDYATKMVDAENEAIKSASEKYYSYIDPTTKQTVVTGVLKSDRDSAYKDLLNALPDAGSDYDKAQMINQFALSYKPDDYEINRLLNAAGISASELDKEMWSVSEWMDANKKGEEIPDGVFVAESDWNKWRNEGEQEYTIKLVKDTYDFWHWGNGNNTIDENDRISIYYPDGTPVVENIRIDQLPKSKNGKLQKAVTAWTGDSGTKTGSTTKMKLNLSDRGTGIWMLSDVKEA